MNRKILLLVSALLLGAMASPLAVAGTMNLDSFVDQSPATVDVGATKLLMATVNTSGAQGGNDASGTTVSIGGTVAPADIAEVCVNYNGVEISCQASPSSLANISLSLAGSQKGGAAFDYNISLNPSAGGKTIQLTVESVTNTNLTDNIPLPASTATRSISGGGTAPTVTSPTHTNVTHNSAVLGGTVTDLGTPASLSGGCGVEWGLAPGNWPNSVSGALPCSVVNDTFIVTVNGLPSSDDIYYRAWANNGLDGFSAEGGPFTTNAPPTVPTVTTRTVESIGENSAILGGDVTADGGATITERGIYWRQNLPNAENGTKIPMALGAGLGQYFETVNGLPAGTDIYYRAYAVNSAGEALGPEPLPFTTLAGLATVTTRAVESITADSAVLGGFVTSDGGAAVTVRGIVWNTTDVWNTANPPASEGTVVTMASGTGEFFGPVDTLPTGVEVYFKGYATNAEGTAYSGVQFFTPAGPPVVTSSVANIGLESAELGGNVTSDGGSAVVERGVYWSTASPATAGSKEIMGSGTGIFSKEITDLPLGTTIYYEAYATNAQDTGYSGELFFDTLSEPTVQASIVTFPQESGRSMRISWTRGNGTGVIVVLRLDTTGITAPQDGDDYLANQDFTVAPELPVNSNNFVVYKGAGTSILVTGLVENTAYSVAVYEYGGTGIDTDYLLTDAPLSTNKGTHSTTDVPVHNMDFGVNCDNCHKHGAFATNGDDGLIVSCQNCHSNGQPATAKQEFSNHLAPNKNQDGVTYVDCGVCHELHNPGGDNTTWSYNPVTDQSQYNKSFLRANVDKYIPGAVSGAFLHTDQPKRADPHPDAPLDADTPDRAVEGGDDVTSRGYCQVCHTYTKYHTNNPGVSASDQCHDGSTGNCGPAETHCGECHEHNDTFKGKGGSTTCMVCHASTQQLGTLDRREIMSEFDYPATAQTTHIYATNNLIQEADCTVCHDFNTHQQQSVTVKDVDGSATFAQSNPEVSAQIPGEGAPLSEHCFSCHDDGVAGGLPASGSDQTQTSPFTNSNAAPAINGGDTSLWTNASHNGAPTVGCVGCHVGHGSTEASLLKPNPPVFPSGAADSNYPTDFCINCHDADGPSSLNIAAEFDTGTDYQVLSGMNGALNNQRHDVIGAAPTAVGCMNCHTPHVDNNANPVRDPETGLVLNTYSITTESGSGAWNGVNYDAGGNSDPSNPEGGGSVTEPDYIQFCLVCHDGAAPAGVDLGSSPDISADYASRGKQHGTGEGGSGTGTGKGNLKPPWTTAADYAAGLDPPAPYAALNCSTCHGPHGSGNLYNLRTSINVAGVQMSTGGQAGSQFEGIVTTTYTLPDNGSGQEKDVYGAWCTFCHNMNAHAGVDETSNCNSGHRHGGNNF